MAKINFGQSKLSKFINGKGFYVALTLCLVGAGVAGWAAINSTIGEVTDQSNQFNDNFTQENERWDFDQTTNTISSILDAEVNNTVSGLPMQENQLQDLDSLENSLLDSTDTADSKELQDKSTQQPESAKLLYMWPITGDIINDFSHGELVKSKTLNDWRTHDGIDIKTSKGTTVQAVADGVVANIYDDSLWGTVVTIDHADGRTSIYASLNEATTVKVGDEIRIGDIIGTVGDSAEIEVALDTHLHFAMMQNDEYIDPLEMLNGGRSE